MSTNSFARLTPELHDLILVHCPRSIIPKLAQTSRFFYDICTFHIYRTIDFSLHNKPLPSSTIPISGIPIREDTDTSNTSADQDFHSRRVSILARQKLFIRTIIARPELGEHVKHLTWTLLSPPTRTTFTAFQALTSITTLDMGSLLLYPEITSPPALLFPTVTSLRLAGRFTLCLTTAVLSSIDPTRLTTLTLDNVLAFGHLSPPSRYSPECSEVSDNDDSDAQPSRRSLKPVTRLPGSTRGLRSGPMYGHLYALFSHLEGLPALRHLTLSSVGQDDEIGLHWSHAREEERYTEWAQLISLSRSALQTLIIDQSPTCWKRRIGHRWTWQCPNQQDLRPMDDRFEKHILTVLKDGGFERLRRLEVRGVGGKLAWGSRSFVFGEGGWWKGWIAGVEEGVRGYVGDETVVVFEKEGRFRLSVCAA